MIVEVFVTEGDAENPLGEHGVLVMFDFGGITRIWNGVAQGSDQSCAVFDFPKQQDAGVGSDTSTFKIGKDLLGSEFGKLERFFKTRCHA
jgi:hypothetical protein